MMQIRLLQYRQHLAGVILVAGAMSIAHAQTTSDPLPAPLPGAIQVPNLDGLPGGVVLNRTMTIVGHDFYQYFSTAWRARDNSERYSIAIIERPTAIRGSEVWVEYRNRRIYRIFLSPRRSAIKKISQQAVGIVYENIVERDLQQLLYPDQDLAKEELQ